MIRKTAPIPDVAAQVFEDGIQHPDLWLWDSWTYEHQGEIRLVCLALSRVDHDGRPILPHQRNDYQFHMRAFVSRDMGHTWRDQGSFQSPGLRHDGADSGNIWSGSVISIKGALHSIYTGLRDLTDDRQFLQSLCITAPAFQSIQSADTSATLSDPLRDYDEIIRAGYYLGPRDELGSNSGEDGGPIMAWRDPFVIEDDDGELQVFWSAKVGPKTPAIASAKLIQKDGRYRLGRLQPPIRLPDEHLMTQAEVPKLFKDPASGTFFLMISACDRLFEGQPDDEVSKTMRLYSSPCLNGPWECHASSCSSLQGLDDLFGASILSVEFETGDMQIIAPFTEMAQPKRQLTFAQVRKIKFAQTIKPSGATEIA